MDRQTLAGRPTGVLFALVASMRPLHWARNAFVLAALLFDKKMHKLGPWLRASEALALFCLVAGGVYLVNALLDMERDRQHPTKRKRPLASGQLPVAVAAVAALVCLGGGVGLGMRRDPLMGAILFTYVLINLAYSVWLKHVVVVDAFAVASGYVLRVAAGAVAVQVERFSPWLYVFTLFFAMLVSLAKRRQELLLLGQNGGAHRTSLHDYTIAFFDHSIGIMAVVYALYTFSAQNLPANHAMMLTIPLAMFAFLRYLYLVYSRGEGGSPDDLFWTDRPLLAGVLLWGAVAAAVLYLPELVRRLGALMAHL